MLERRMHVLVLLLAGLSGVGFGVAIRASARQAPAPTPQVGSLLNGSFEEVAGVAPVGWKATVWLKDAELTVDSGGHTGTHSARIASTTGADAAWTAVVLVRPYARYRLSGWIKTEGVDAGTGAGARLGLRASEPLWTAALTGTRDWSPVTVEFNTDGNDAVQVDCRLGGGGKSRGVAWFDDIQIEQLSARDLKPSITVEVGKVRPPSRSTSTASSSNTSGGASTAASGPR